MRERSGSQIREKAKCKRKTKEANERERNMKERMGEMERKT